MKIEALLFGVIVVMGGVIAYLAVLLFQPPQRIQPLTFERLMNLTRDLRDEVKEVNLTYIVNLTLNNTYILGEMNFYKDGQRTEYILSNELVAYEGYGLLLSPLSQVNFIQENTRQEYSGLLINVINDERCFATITAPNGTQYEKIINGDYLFITCFENITGYPSVMLNSEVYGDQVVTSYAVLANRSYRK